MLYHVGFVHLGVKSRELSEGCVCGDNGNTESSLDARCHQVQDMGPHSAAIQCASQELGGVPKHQRKTGLITLLCLSLNLSGSFTW